MSIKINEVESQIFVLTWEGEISLAEIEQSHEDTYQIALANGYSRYVHIVDLGAMQSYPMDIAGLWKVLVMHPEAFCIFLVNMPGMASTFARMLNGLVKKVNLIPMDSVSDATARARELLTAEPVR